MIKQLFALLCILAVIFPLQAQEDYLSEGGKLLKEKKYKEAIYFYKYANIDNNPDALFKRAYCYFKTNNFSKAQKDIIQSINRGNQNPETLFLMGQMKHSESKYKEAITFYKDYLKAVGSDDPSRPIVVEYVKNCNSAINYRFKSAKGTAVNMGSAVNSPYDEMSPLTSPNYDNVYYFSSNRKSNKQEADVEVVSYNYDIYRIESNSNNNSFTPALPINPEMNGIENEVLLDISDDGQILFFSQGFNEKYVYADTFGVIIPEYLERQKMASPFNENSVDYLDVYKDNIFVFASKNLDGYGGYDLYGTMMINGAWIEPFNLGPQINTIYDEVSPYIAVDGTSLYFSSNRIKGIGGYDIYNSKYSSSKNKWSRATNMLPPINSDKDELYFRLHKNGRSGVFVSDRLLNSQGAFDIYQTELVGGSGVTPSNKIVPDFVQNYLDSYQEEEIFIVPNDEIIYSYEDEIYGEEQEDNEEAPTEEEQLIVSPSEYPVTEPGTSLPEEILNFQNRSLLPDKNGEIVSERNQLLVQDAARFLQSNPGTKIELVGHTLKEGLPEYDLYFSLKIAEEVKNLFTAQNIAGDRILLKGLGSAYPLVKYDSGGQAVAMAEKMNKRVEMNLIPMGNTSFNITQEQNDVPDYLRATENQLYNTLKDGLSYKIQIAETDKLLKNEVLTNYKHIMMENTSPSKKYLYTVGMYDNYTETFFIKRELEGYNVDNPQVIPFVNGQRVERQNLFLLAEKYPDLANYIEYEIE